MIITPEQIHAARALLRMDQDELARRAQISVVTIRRLEAEGDRQGAEEAIDAVRHVLEDAGAEFIEDGVRRKRKSARDRDAMLAELMAISKRSAAELAGRDDLLTEDDLYDENGLPH